MDELNKLAILNDSTHFWIPSLRRSGFVIYWIMIGISLSGFLALFFVQVDISVRANGIVRTYDERTAIHLPARGMIEQMLGECYVSAKDIGMIKVGQTAKFQIEAFDYNYFGMATGQVFSIANDVILIDRIPVFKVMCRLNETSLKLSNGFTGVIKKGMGFRARFKITKRTLWQLLYDNLKNWFDPTQGPV